MSAVMIHQIALFGRVEHLPRTCVLLGDVGPHAKPPEIVKEGLVELVIGH
jgi:hypothetical protein